MLAQALAFTTACFAVLGLGSLMPQRTRRRRGAPALLEAMARRLHPVTGSAQGLEVRILAAGLGGTLAARELMSAKLVAAMAGGLGALGVGALAPGRLGLILMIGGPLAGFLAPDLWLRRRTLRRFEQVRRHLPAMLDLLRVTVEAGASLTAGLAAVGQRTKGPLAAEARAVARQVQAGVTMEQALEDLRRRLPLEEVTALVAALERSRRHGTPTAEILARAATNVRERRRRAVQEEAARAAPKIQLVVALLLVPSVLLLVSAALLSALVEPGAELHVR